MTMDFGLFVMMVLTFMDFVAVSFSPPLMKNTDIILKTSIPSRGPAGIACDMRYTTSASDPKSFKAAHLSAHSWETMQKKVTS